MRKKLLAMWLLLLALNTMAQRPAWKVRINLDPPVAKPVDGAGYTTRLLIDTTNYSLKLLIEHPATRESYKLPARSEKFAIHAGKKIVAISGKASNEGFATLDGPLYLQGCFVYNFSGKLLFTIDGIETRQLFFTADGTLLISGIDKVMAYNASGTKLWEKKMPSPQIKLLNDQATTAIETFEFSGGKHALHVVTGNTGREIYKASFSNNQSISALSYDAMNKQLLLANSTDNRSGLLNLQQVDLISGKTIQSPVISQTALALLAVKNKTSNTWYFLIDRMAPAGEQIHFAKWEINQNNIAISDQPVGAFHPADFSFLENGLSDDSAYKVRYQHRTLTIRF